MTNYDERDQVFLRFVHLLRRWWWAVAAGVVVCLGVAILGVHSEYQQTTTFQKVENSARLASAGFEPNVISQQLSMAVDLGELTTESVKSSVQSRVSTKIDRSITSSPDGAAVILTVSGTKRADVQAATDAYVKQFVDGRTHRYQLVADGIAKELDNASSLLQQRIDSIDQELGGVSDPTGSLANALVVGRQDAMKDLTKADRQRAAVEEARDDPAEVVNVILQSSEVSSLSRTVAAGGAAVLALLVGLAILYVLARLDRRVRSRSDIVTATGSSLLGILDANPSDQSVSRSGSILTALAAQRNQSIIQLVPASADPSLVSVLESLAGRATEASGPFAHVRLSIDQDPSVVKDDGLVVVVARFGASKIVELEQLARDLHHAGRDLGGVILCGVPSRDLAWANGSDRH